MRSSAMATVEARRSRSSGLGVSTTQRTNRKGMFSRTMLTPYSVFKRYSSTSICSTPTTPAIISSRPMLGRLKVWIAPSWLSWLMPFKNCLRFMESSGETRQKYSGANSGMPEYLTGEPVQMVSPRRKMPGSNRPMMSPG